MSSQFPSTADVVIAGGGPAGATLARLLVDLGFHVVVCEKRRFPRHQIGESLTPQIFTVLDFLGVRSRVEARGFMRMAGHTVCWGNDLPRTSYYSNDQTRRGFQVWREDFDALLLTYAREGGAQVFEQQAVKNVRFGKTGVTVSTTHGQITANFFIDATGHAGVLARQALRQRDVTFQTLAITGYWRNAGNPAGVDFANTLLETYENGLVWSVPLHNGLRNVTLLVDWQIGEQIRHSGLQAVYQAELPKAPYISQFVSHAQVASPLKAFDATWHTASTFAGDRFLLVGDAGMFVDPLSSEGVHKAMASAITGAAVINTILRRPTMTAHAIEFYDERQRSTYNAYYQRSALYYAEERRWPNSLFWQRRRQPKLQISEAGIQTLDVHFPVVTLPSPLPNIVISHLTIAPGVTIEPRPVIEGPFVELRNVVIAPLYPHGVRFVENICLPTLLQIVQQDGAVAHIIPAYLASPEGKTCPPESVRQILARCYHEGILRATAPDETQ